MTIGREAKQRALVDEPIPGDFSPQPETAAVRPTTNLQLSPERLSWLVTHTIKRIEDCRTDMGLEFGNATARPFSWAWDRQVGRMQYAGNFEWRKQFSELFTQNNWSMNVPQRFIRLLSAKMGDDLLGTEPFFAGMPENPDDHQADLSKQVERKIQRETARSNMREMLVEAIRVALTEGERAVKITNLYDETTFFAPATVAVDAAGQPIKTASGDYIFPKDDFIQDPTVEGQMRLKKELSYVISEPPVYARFDRLEQKLVHHDGLRADSLQCEDFIYPINVPSLDQADIMAHCYDEHLDAVAALYKNTEFAQQYRSLAATGALAASSQPNKEMGEGMLFGDRTLEMLNIHECYVKADADQDGKPEWIFLVLDLKSRLPIYAEYMAALKMNKPPFVLIRGVESVPNRAYGVGVYKMMADGHLYIDLCFNRIALKNSKEVSLTFQHKDGTEETRRGLEMKLGDKKIYTIPTDSDFNKENPPIFRVNLAEMDEFAIQHMERMIQAEQLRFGIFNAADVQSSNMPSSETATSVRNIERTGNLLQRATEDMIASDLKKAVEIAVDCVLENADEDELLFTPGSEQIATLNRDEIRRLPRDVRILMTKARGEETIALNTSAKTAILEYYGLPPAMRKLVRTQYIAILKAYYVPDADEKLVEPTEQEIQAASQASGETKPMTESVRINYPDLQRTEQEQILQRNGIQPEKNIVNDIGTTAAGSGISETPSAAAA